MNRLACFLFFDEGPGAGLGHRRRMEALAAELTHRGHSCTLCSLDERAARVPGGTPDVVIVDSYRVRADDGSFAPARVLVAVDDLAQDLAVDLVVDPSPGAIGATHRRARRVLAGAAYALVAVADDHPFETSVDEVERVLVTTGAADSSGADARIATALASSLDETRPEVEVRLVIGPWGARDVPAGVVPVHAPDGLARELAAAQVVVTAGGVALLESCVLGRPTVALALAENQRQAVRGLEHAHAVLSATPETVVETVMTLIDDRSRRIALGVAARSAIDGKGATRIADTIEQLVSR